MSIGRPLLRLRSAAAILVMTPVMAVCLVVMYWVVTTSYRNPTALGVLGLIALIFWVINRRNRRDAVQLFTVDRGSSPNLLAHIDDVLLGRNERISQVTLCGQTESEVLNDKTLVLGFPLLCVHPIVLRAAIVFATSVDASTDVLSKRVVRPCVNFGLRCQSGIAWLKNDGKLKLIRRYNEVGFASSKPLMALAASICLTPFVIVAWLANKVMDSQYERIEENSYSEVSRLVSREAADMLRTLRTDSAQALDDLDRELVRYSPPDIPNAIASILRPAVNLRSELADDVALAISDVALHDAAKQWVDHRRAATVERLGLQDLPWLHVRQA
jgi:hypothetical protein